VEKPQCSCLCVNRVRAAREAVTRARKPSNPLPENPVSQENCRSPPTLWDESRTFRPNVRKFSKKKMSTLSVSTLHVRTGDGCRACLAVFETSTVTTRVVLTVFIVSSCRNYRAAVASLSSLVVVDGHLLVCLIMIHGRPMGMSTAYCARSSKGVHIRKSRGGDSVFFQ